MAPQACYPIFLNHWAQCSNTSLSQPDLGASKNVLYRARLCEGANQQRTPHLADGGIVGACPLMGKATPSSSSPFQEPQKLKGPFMFLINGLANI